MSRVLKPILKRGGGMATKGMIEGQDERAAVLDAGAAKVRFNSANLKGSYANFCNATSTREEVVLNFAVGNNRDRTPHDVEIERAHRVVQSPFAVKRLTNMLLQRHMSEYESRHGGLDQCD